MSLLTATGFKKLKRSNMRLNSRSGGAFDIQNNNDFIKPHGQKNRVRPLGKDQRELFAKKTEHYTAAANKSLVTTLVITFTISAGLILLAKQAITLLLPLQ